MDEEMNERLRRCVDPKLRAEGYAQWLAEHTQIHVRIFEYPEPGVFYEVPRQPTEGKKIHPDVASRLKDAPGGEGEVHTSSPTHTGMFVSGVGGNGGGGGGAVITTGRSIGSSGGAGGSNGGGCCRTQPIEQGSVPPALDVQPKHKVGDTVACKGSIDAWIVAAVRPAERSSRGALKYEIVGPKLMKAWCTADEVRLWPSGEAGDMRLGQALQLRDGRTGVVYEMSLKQTANPWDVAIARILIDGASGDDVELVDAKSKFDIIHSALRRFDPNDRVLVCGRLDPRWGRAGFIVDIDDELVLVRFCEGDRMPWEQHWICHENLVGVTEDSAYRPLRPKDSITPHISTLASAATAAQQGWEAFAQGLQMQRDEAEREHRTHPTEKPGCGKPTPRQEVDQVVMDPPYYMAYCPVQDRQPSEPSLAQRAAKLRDHLIHDPSFITIDWTLFR